MPQTSVSLIAANCAPIRTEFGLTIVPDAAFDDVGKLDVLVVPGGWGVDAQLENAQTLAFLQRVAADVRFVTSVCSGALLLGAAGLLQGYRATTYWMSLDLLRHFGAEPVDQRVVRDRITGGGVTAGIDFALVVAAELFGDAVAQSIQLAIEYRPSPPFNGGGPDTAPTDVTEHVRRASEPSLVRRRTIIERVSARNHDRFASPDSGTDSDGQASG